jgi:transcription elongation factor GreA
VAEWLPKNILPMRKGNLLDTCPGICMLTQVSDRKPVWEGDVMGNVPISRTGFEKLKRELEYLKKFAVPENIKDIEEARAHGDISENAEYEAAKEKQAFIQGKMQEIKNNLASSIIIDPEDLTEERVVFGSTVTIEDVSTEEVIQYLLVGPFESDVDENKISVTSPIGKGLIGKEIGDVVSISTPGGVKEFEIIDISINDMEGRNQ